MTRSWWTALLLLPLLTGRGIAAEPPRPPCGVVADPGYPARDGAPSIRLTTVTNWTVPACLGWRGPPPDLLVALSGRVRIAGGEDAILARAGAVSGLRDIRYWSVTGQAWQMLVTDAYASTDATGATRRPDFQPREMPVGVFLNAAQSDSRTAGYVTYRIQVLERGANRVAVSIENISPVRTTLFTLFDPEAVRTTYFLDRLGPDEWGYYALSGITTGTLTSGHPASWINRAVAFYRFFAGERTDQEPPAARD